MIEDPRLGLSLCTPVNHSTTNMYQQPLTQHQPPPQQQQHISMYMNRARGGSVSSLTSSISDTYTYSNNFTTSGNNSINNNGDISKYAILSNKFIDLIMNVYLNVSSDPTITPFDPTSPPAGILNRVAMLSIEQAITQQCDTGTRIPLQSNAMVVTIRHTLNQEIRREGYMSRNGSQSSLVPPPPQFTELLNSTHNISDPLDPTFFKSSGEPLCIGNNLLQPQPTLKCYKNTNKDKNNTNMYVLTPNNSMNNLINSNNSSGNLPSLHHSLLPRQTFRTASPLSTTSFSNNSGTSSLTAANICRHEQSLADSLGTKK
ncbi:similar to Saccharomyces cerevisiae YPL014W Putative protein of unknown function [Maudiozyma barnettii]|uniref:Uncharacterized protein n=1 Tax=Maudiozyma barnettii TaxID=61262 RepID=A0A8H2VF89_9SACH|nr:Cip1p [Kazachstania barnettii]CAB4254391.1 similar to Saccharomyces cerevisiae YPL014W Putative protein of unknown function [Kazachstania barnettii]CAD1782293.1 similar to Saccharomyces cerevisiae YPL014W Putative protein of unknown function [Kazachstania barnettii]